MMICLLLMAMAPIATAQTRDEINDASEVWKQFDTPPSPPLSTDEAIGTFRLPPGFAIELVAAEPMIEDPVAIKWDADGRLWVVEMRTYMLNRAGDGERAAGSRIVVLSDDDHDGRVDRSTVFLDGLVMPRAIAHVRGGVLVAEPPNLWLCRDVDGDLKCDRKTKVYEGYAPQLELPTRSSNGLLFNLDNWLYSTISSDRLRVRDGAVIALPTLIRGDWGVSRDDFGRLFLTNNSSYLRANLLPAHDLIRNPHGSLEPAHHAAVVTDESVHTIRTNTGISYGGVPGALREDGRLAHTTAACGQEIYRGDQYPPAFYGNAFICEPAGNAVARFSLRDRGVAIEAQHELTDDPQWSRREFLVSGDERFRPVNIETGPDGCLYIVDFYRGILEYKYWITKFLGAQLDARGLEAPASCGRIYRIVYQGGPPPMPPPRLADAPAAQLVAQFERRNGWRRDTAQRLIVERGERAAAPLLKSMAATSDNPIARLHAHWTLEGLGEVDAATIAAALRDPHPQVRIAGLQIGRRLIGTADEQAFFSQLAAMVDDPDAAVRVHLMLALGAFADRPEAENLMAALLTRDAADPFMRQAAISGLADREMAMLGRLLDDPAWIGPEVDAGRAAMLQGLAATVVRRRNSDELNVLLGLIAVQPASLSWRRAAMLEGMINAADRPRPIALPRRPAALNMLAAIDEPGLASRMEKITQRLTWPGDARAAANVSRAAPLDAAQQAQFDQGQVMFLATCALCHQADGRGQTDLIPPLLDSPWVLGSPQRLARIILQGMAGPITVHERQWNLVMPGQQYNPVLSDERIAAVMTYVRRAWGHTADPVDAATVSEIRRATAGRDLPWTAAELEQWR